MRSTYEIESGEIIITAITSSNIQFKNIGTNCYPNGLKETSHDP